MSSDVSLEEDEIHKSLDCITNQVQNMEISTELTKDFMENPEYDLQNYQYRGLVVVFNHENYDFDLESRTGTDKDAARLQTVFKARGFLVLPTFNNKSHAEIKSILGKASKVKREMYGSVVVVVLSHGLDGGQIAAKDKIYSASDLRAPFLDNPAFKDKPLIFLHQACRGKNKETFANKKSPSTFKNGDVLLPGQNDVLLAFATLEGHQSYRHKTEGSFYIQKLCDILEKRKDVEILDLLTAANCEVIEFCGQANEKMDHGFDKIQTATFKSSLLKRFVLSTNATELDAISDKNQFPEECYVSQPECEYRGPAIIFHDENHTSEASDFLISMKELNFSCQTVDHEPTDRELTNLSGNIQLEECSCLFIGMFFDESRLNFLHSSLLERLNNKSCSYMNSKPKVFLLACKEGTTLKKEIKMDDLKTNRQVTCYSDVLAIYGYTSNFLNSFAMHLRLSRGNDVVSSARFAQRHAAEEIDRPCNVIMSSTLRFRVDWSKKMLVQDENALKVSSVFQYHVRDPVANFQHRTTELAELSKVLQNDATKCKPVSVNVWVTGFGGLGKSQTVLQYIQKARTENIYKNILWIDGSSTNSIRRDVQNIAESLDINLPITEKLSDKLKRFYSKITEVGRTLLVIDNLEDLKNDKLIDVLPKAHKNELLRIVVTSVHKAESFSKKLTSMVGTYISINPFTQKESQEFITKNLKFAKDIPETLIDSLGEELSYFPLALAIAVGFANENTNSSSSPSDVIENIIKNMQNIQEGDSKTKGYNKSIYQIVTFTINDLEKNKQELALKYLKMMSICEPENIPHEILFRCERMGPETNAIKKLKSLHLINDNMDLFSIHRIVQSIVCNYLGNGERKKYILQCLMQNVFQLQNEKPDYTKTRQYILHAAKICNNIGSFPDLYTENKDCIITISSELQLVGWYEDAMKFNENHLKCSYQTYGEDSTEYCDLLMHKVLILNLLEEHEEALSWIAVLETLEPYTGNELLTKRTYLYTNDQKFEIHNSKNIQKLYTFSGQIEGVGEGFEELVRIEDDNDSPVFVTPSLATPVNIEKQNVPLKYIQQANDIKINAGIQKAQILHFVGKLNEALEVTKNLLCSDLAYELITLLDLINVRAKLLEEFEKFEEALELYDRALAIRRQTYKGTVNYDLTIKENKASVLIEMKRYEDARDLLFALQSAKEKQLGENHPETFTTRHNISTLLYRMGKSDEALKLTNEILDAIGDSNKTFLTKLNVLENKSKILAGMKNINEALDIMQDVYKQRIARFGEKDLKTFKDMYTIACFYMKKVDFENAMHWFKNLQVKQMQNRLENPIRMIMTEIQMSKIFLHQGKYDKALDLENNIIEKQCQMYGERHYRIAQTKRRIAKILYMNGELAEALKMCENAIQVINQNHEQFTEDIIKMKHLKGSILIANENFVGAFVTLQDAMQTIQTCQQIKPAFVCAVKQSLSHVLSKLGQFDDALALGEEVLHESIEILGPDHLDTIAAMNNKAYLLHCLGRNTQALSEIECVEKLREQILGATNPYTLHTKYFRGLILSDLARHREALRVFDFVLEHRREVLDDDHPEVYHTIHHRAKVLLNMGRYDEAFSGLLETEKRKYGEESVQVTCSMNSIATCYERMGQTYEAVEMYSAALQILEGFLGSSHPNVEIVRANRDSAVQKFVESLHQ